MSRSLTLIVVMFVAACGKKTPTNPADKVTYVSEDDPKMNAAIEKARASVGTFTKALAAPKPGQTAFSIKMAFDDGKHVEHMWLTDVKFDGKRFSGTVNNDADRVTNVKIGDKASVEASQISDWMYVDTGKLVGGFTLRVLRDGMSAAERAEFDMSMPFSVD